MRTTNVQRTAITVAIWLLCAGVVSAADHLAPAGDPSSPVQNAATVQVDDFARGDYEDPWRVSSLLTFPGTVLIDLIIRQDGRLNAGNIFNQGSRNDVIEPGDPCHEGSVGSLVMCRN